MNEVITPATIMLRTTPGISSNHRTLLASSQKIVALTMAANNAVATNPLIGSSGVAKKSPMTVARNRFSRRVLPSIVLRFALYHDSAPSVSRSWRSSRVLVLRRRRRSDAMSGIKPSATTSDATKTEITVKGIDLINSPTIPEMKNSGTKTATVVIVPAVTGV